MRGCPDTALQVESIWGSWMSVTIVSASGLFLCHIQPSSGSQLMDTEPSQSSLGMCGPGAGAVCFPNVGKFKDKGLEVGGSQEEIPFLLNLLLKELWWFL